MAALILFIILAWALPGSFLMWIGIFLVGFIVLLVICEKNDRDEQSGKKPTIRIINGEAQDVYVFIETHIEKMYAAGKTDVDVAHSLDFFYQPMWMFYHPFLVRDPSWWKYSDLKTPHERADAFRARMRKTYPQAYCHVDWDPNNSPEIANEFLRFMREYSLKKYGPMDHTPSPSSREPTAREKSIAWTLVTGDPVLGHALGHKDDKKDKR